MSDSAVVLLFIVGPAAAVVLALVLRRLRGGALTRVLAPTVVSLAALYGLGLLAVVTDFRDADGFVDCWPSCSALQNAVGVLVWWGAILLAVVAVAELVYLIAVYARTRDAS